MCTKKQHGISIKPTHWWMKSLLRVRSAAYVITPLYRGSWVKSLFLNRPKVFFIILSSHVPHSLHFGPKETHCFVWQTGAASLCVVLQWSVTLLLVTAWACSSWALPSPGLQEKTLLYKVLFSKDSHPVMLMTFTISPGQRAVSITELWYWGWPLFHAERTQPVPVVQTKPLSQENR